MVAKCADCWQVARRLRAGCSQAARRLRVKKNTTQASRSSCQMPSTARQLRQPPTIEAIGRVPYFADVGRLLVPYRQVVDCLYIARFIDSKTIYQLNPPLTLTLALRYTSIALYMLYMQIISYLYIARFRTIRLYTY